MSWLSRLELLRIVGDAFLTAKFGRVGFLQSFFLFDIATLLNPPISKGNINLTDTPELRFIECQLQIHQYTIASTEILTYDHPTRGRYVIEWHFRTRICKILCLAPLSISLSSD